MNPWRKVPIFTVGIVLLAIIVPLGNLCRHPNCQFLYNDVALAAEEDYPLDPFASKAESVPDPLERSNRVVFQFNDRSYFWLFKPVCTIYSAYFPPGVRLCFRNLFVNLEFPARLINNVLQGKVKGAGIELARFGINSIMGLGGLFDVASTNFSIAPREEDFGLTLRHYGVDNGPYLVLPVFGPSTLRDTAGRVADGFLSPLYYIPWTWVATGTKVGAVVNNVSLKVGKYEALKESAVDPYVSMRNAYIKHRAEQLEP